MSRSPLFKTPKQVFFNPINIFDSFTHSIYCFIIYFFRLTSKFIFTGQKWAEKDLVPETMIVHDEFNWNSLVEEVVDEWYCVTSVVGNERNNDIKQKNETNGTNGTIPRKGAFKIEKLKCSQLCHLN